MTMDYNFQSKLTFVPDIVRENTIDRTGMDEYISVYSINPSTGIDFVLDMRRAGLSFIIDECVIG